MRSATPPLSLALPKRRRVPSISIAQARLTSGLILFAFCLTHFSNHILGIFLVGTMEEWRDVLMMPWRIIPGQILLYGAFLTHLFLALRTLFKRRTMRMPVGQWVQVAAGLSIPLLLIGHVTSVRVAGSLFDAEIGYPKVLLDQWVNDPSVAMQMSALVLIVWTHACLGLYFWLRRYVWYGRFRVAFVAAALLFPSLVLAGYFASGSETVNRVHANPKLAAEIVRESGLTPADVKELRDLRIDLILIYLGLLGAAFGARAARNIIATWRNPLIVEYASGRTVRALAGSSILEVSRANGIPHAAICGGQGRCSTCRIAVISADRPLPKPGSQEASTLRRIGVGPDVRLACQFRPRGRIGVQRLVIEANEAQDSAFAAPVRGREMDLTVMVVDLRRSSRLAQEKLPYDVLYIIDRFLNAVRIAVRDSGGYLVCTTGDGAVAIFGFDVNMRRAARGALRAADAIWASVDRMNTELEADLPWPLGFGVGIAAGPCIVGHRSIDIGSAINFVGDAGNIAARLEEASKQIGAPVVVTEAVAASAGLAAAGADRRTLELRDRLVPVDVQVFTRHGALSEAVAPLE
ncbi:adenylate/guanylate cyclase domain-containing protein [Acuticoccus kandeliae]|uniref:adenylate/guanylate cyclase domain-containing protein n=1 Tax=Acuticoccus kandeliae TaxID=2073160 RepID=UPI000D3E5249|nr:adenylate/guanylate cyclase domain-containing protein [Acuticoccus kandeliae]